MAQNWFTVDGLAPVQDPRWWTSTPAQKLAFFRVCRELVLQQFDLQLSRGLDKMGIGLAALRPKTIRYRKSAMGPADKNAPPLTPAHELSRTRSFVDARIVGNAIQVYWKKGWSRILGYHRDGIPGRMASRNVFGLAPDYKKAVIQQAQYWWAGFIEGLPVKAPIRPRVGAPAVPVVAVQPGYIPKQLELYGPQPATTVNVVIGGDVYSMSKGSAKELMQAIRKGQFTGFRSYAR